MNTIEKSHNKIEIDLQISSSRVALLRDKLHEALLNLTAGRTCIKPCCSVAAIIIVTKRSSTLRFEENCSV